MSIRKIIKDRITALTKEGVACAKDDQATALELLIRREEAQWLLTHINKARRANNK